MSTRTERAMSGVPTLAAVVIAATLARREFAPSRSAAVVRSAAQPATQVRDWDALLRAGILVGDPDARVKIVEFGDFECPFCAQFSERFQRIKRQFGRDVALVYIHLPLSNQHRFAMPAARAAECADASGRFGEYSEVLFRKQDSLGLKSWNSFAVDAGVKDTAAFGQCVSRTGVLPRVEAGRAAAAKYEVRSTPSIFINGWHLFTPPSDSILGDAVAALISGKNPKEVSQDEVESKSVEMCRNSTTYATRWRATPVRTRA